MFGYTLENIVWDKEVNTSQTGTFQANKLIFWQNYKETRLLCSTILFIKYAYTSLGNEMRP